MAEKLEFPSKIVFFELVVRIVRTTGEVRGTPDIFEDIEFSMCRWCEACIMARIRKFAQLFCWWLLLAALKIQNNFLVLLPYLCFTPWLPYKKSFSEHALLCDFSTSRFSLCPLKVCIHCTETRCICNDSPTLYIFSAVIHRYII